MSTSSSSTPDGTVGHVEIGLVIATFLFGIETLQTFNYYREYPNDRRMLKTLVAGIWLLELAHLICSCHAIYLVTVTFYGQPQQLLNTPPSLVFTIILQAPINFVVQTFFAFRVQTLSKQWSFTILCCVLNFLRLFFNVGLFVELWKRPEWSFLTIQLRWMIITASSIGPSVDIGIATALCYCLWRYKNSDFKQLSGALLLILFLTRNDLIWMIFYLIQTRLFANSMLASLNGRHRLRSTPDRSRQLEGGLHVLAFNSATPTRDTSLIIYMQQVTTIGNNEPKENISVAGPGNEDRSST
ncbi:hypothetical protein DFH09DRAFT_1271525 [Mycena vulgaris]|nr:hypothetical protein DFH09DRAFT_1271525 [Mycena vulgaris]